MITPNDTIGYIRKILKDGKEQFEYIESKITAVRIGKKGTKAYSDKFSPLDVEEVEFNTKWLKETETIIIITEPFITSPDLAERCKRFVTRKNEEGNR